MKLPHGLDPVLKRYCSLVAKIRSVAREITVHRKEDYLLSDELTQIADTINDRCGRYK